jgi:hypothetical protein
MYKQEKSLALSVGCLPSQPRKEEPITLFPFLLFIINRQKKEFVR